MLVSSLEHLEAAIEVAGRPKNRRLARVTADAGFGEIRRQLTYPARSGWWR